MKNDRAMEKNLIEERPDAVKDMEEKMAAGLDGWSVPENMRQARLKQMNYTPIPVKAES